MTRDLQRALGEHVFGSELRKNLVIEIDLALGGQFSFSEMSAGLGTRREELTKAIDFLKGNGVIAADEGQRWFVLDPSFWRIPRRGRFPARLLREADRELIAPEPGLARGLSAAELPTGEGDAVPPTPRYDVSRAAELWREDQRDGGCRSAEYNARFQRAVAGVPSPVELVPSRSVLEPAAPRGSPPPRRGAPPIPLASCLAKPCTKEAEAIAGALALQPATSAGPQGGNAGEEALRLLRELSPQEFDRFSTVWRGAALKDGAQLLEVARYGVVEVRRREAAGDPIRRPLAYLLPRAKERRLV